MAKHSSKQAKHNEHHKIQLTLRCGQPDKAITNQSIANAMWPYKLQATKNKGKCASTNTAKHSPNQANYNKYRINPN